MHIDGQNFGKSKIDDWGAADSVAMRILMALSQRSVESGAGSVRPSAEQHVDHQFASRPAYADPAWPFLRQSEGDEAFGQGFVQIGISSTVHTLQSRLLLGAEIVPGDGHDNVSLPCLIRTDFKMPIPRKTPAKASSA
nr:hypothetical protein P9270_028100 [Mesorhizobium sp. WSM4875]